MVGNFKECMNAYFLEVGSYIETAERWTILDGLPLLPWLERLAYRDSLPKADFDPTQF